LAEEEMAVRQRRTLARRLPDRAWALFESVLPPASAATDGRGRPPASNHKVFHGLIYVLVTGIPWECVPPCFPRAEAIRDRLTTWLRLDAFHSAWQQLAQRYKLLRGVNWDQVLADRPGRPVPRR
jgi:transposase